MERIKNYKIPSFFQHDLLDVSSELFYVCAMLGNFHPPLVS